jgi:hypothetical protein
VRKIWIGAALAVFISALGIGSASATNVRLLTGTATFSDSGTAQIAGNPPGCFVTDSVDGSFAGQFIANPVNTPVERGTFHSAACGNFTSPTVVTETGLVTVTTQVGTASGTEVGTANFVTGAINETWTITSATGAYHGATGTITMSGQGIFTGPLTFTQSGTLTFNVTR